MMIESITPLIAIDAIAFDTETTGVDVRTASVIEIGALRIVSGVLRPEDVFRSLVQPLGRIDPEALRAHGIDEAQVRDAPRFQDVWPLFAEFVGDSVLIGHTVGFDLAILERQLAGSGQVWRRPRMLDTQLLAQLVSPKLGKCSLDDLADQFDIDVEKRHSAIGDATIAARVFFALLPQLLQRNIRTLEDAEAASRTLTRSLDDYQRANWVEPVAPAEPARMGTPPRRDLHAYRHRVADVMSAPPRFVKPELSINEALQSMLRQGVSSVFVGSEADAARSDRVGIVTERDILRAFAVHSANAFAMAVEALVSWPLVTVAADSFAYLAIARMRRLRIRHLGVIDEQGKIVGAVSARDLLRLHGEPAILIDDEIEQADSVQSLSKAWAKLHGAASLMVSDVPPRELAGLISQVLCEMTARATLLAERALQDRGLGPPPCPYATFVLGSAGRGESLLSADQDNGLVFLSDDPDGENDRWFAALAGEMSDILHAAGIAYCPGKVMATNPAWRGSVATWERRVESWIGRSSPQDLLSVDIFFDMKPVYGDASLALSLWRGAFDRARGNSSFAKLLAEASAGHMMKGLTLFGGFKTTDGRIDLKRTGSFGLVTAARVLAIRHHVVERSTFTRFETLKERGEHEVDFDRFKDALELFLKMLLRQQIIDMRQGRQPGNGVIVQGLSRHEREQLHEALASVRHVDEFVRDLLF
jgi:DNA polymerase-3 subunit epsilon/CBS domain-containing protein